MHVDEWRSGLWQQALQTQDIHDADMAKALQERFRTSRLEHFVMDHGVRVEFRAIIMFLLACKVQGWGGKCSTMSCCMMATMK